MRQKSLVSCDKNCLSAVVLKLFDYAGQHKCELRLELVNYLNEKGYTSLKT